MQFIQLTLKSGGSVLINRSKMHHVSALGSGSIVKVGKSRKVFKVTEPETSVSLDAPYTTGLVTEMLVIRRNGVDIAPTITTFIMDDIDYIIPGWSSGAPIATPLLHVFMTSGEKYIAIGFADTALADFNAGQTHGISPASFYVDGINAEPLTQGQQPTFIFTNDMTSFAALNVYWPCIVFLLTSKELLWFDGSDSTNITKANFYVDDTNAEPISQGQQFIFTDDITSFTALNVDWPCVVFLLTSKTVLWFDGSALTNITKAYKEYLVTLTQTGEDDPTITKMLQVEDVTLALARSAEGIYTATTADLLDYDIFFEPRQFINIDGDYMTIELTRTPEVDDVFTIKTYTAAGAAADAKLAGTLFQFKYKLS